MSLETDAGKATVVQACKVFGLSRAAWYAAQQDPPEARPTLRLVREPRPGYATAEELRPAIRAIVDGHPAWGVRKVWATLRREPYDIRAGVRRVWALMRSMNLTLSADRPPRRQEPRGHVAVEEPNRRWCTDLTTVWTKQDGLVAVIPVVDCGDRSCLALDATKPQDSPAVLAPVRQALVEQLGDPAAVPDGLELRTDHGPQYTGADCEEMCDDWHLEHTFAPVGRPTGNAVAERFIRTLKEECLWLRDWDSLDEVRAALARFRHVYNHGRPHQALSWHTPAERRAERLGGLARAA